MTGSRSRWAGEPSRTGHLAVDPYARIISLPSPPPDGPSDGGAGGRARDRHSWVDRAASRRTERDRQEVLRLVDEVMTVAEPVDRIHRLLRLISVLLQADAGGFEQLDLRTGQRTTVRWPDARVVVAPGPAGHQPVAPEPRPDLPVDYRTLFATLPTRHQLAIPLLLDGTMAVSLAAGRHARAFHDHELGRATALQLALTPLRLRLAQPDVHAEPAIPVRTLLTPREQEILGQLATGRTSRAISQALGVSPHTVSKHLENLYTKLGVNCRLSAVTQAQSLGLLPLAIRRRAGTPAPSRLAAIAPIGSPAEPDPASQPAAVAPIGSPAEPNPALQPAAVAPIGSPVEPDPALQPAARHSPPPPPQILSTLADR